MVAVELCTRSIPVSYYMTLRDRERHDSRSPVFRRNSIRMFLTLTNGDRIRCGDLYVGQGQVYRVRHAPWPELARILGVPPTYGYSHSTKNDQIRRGPQWRQTLGRQFRVLRGHATPLMYFIRCVSRFVLPFISIYRYISPWYRVV